MIVFTQSNTAVSQQYTVKNIEVAGQLEIETSNPADIEELTYYIMYVPEGYAIDLNLPLLILNGLWHINMPVNQLMASGLIQPPKIKTRLSRRLNTGYYIFIYAKY